MLRFIAGIILYLILISTFFGFIVTESQNEEFKSLNIEMYSGDVVDFSSQTNFEKLIDSNYINSQSWNIEDNTLIFDGIYSSAYFNKPIFFKGIQKNSDNEYNVKYHFNNSEDLTFQIWLSDGGILESDAYILIYDKTTLKMYNPYYHSTIGSFLKTEMFSIPMSLSGEHIITTIINPTTQTLKIYVDSNLIQEIPTEIKESYPHYGGILITETGTFTLTKIESTIRILESIDNMNFLSLIANLLLWSVPEKYMPLMFNIILIKFPLLILSIATAFYIRGVM